MSIGLVRKTAATFRSDALKESGPDIDPEGQNRRIEQEGQHRGSEPEPAHAARADRDVGRLSGCADGEREIEEVEIVRLVLSGEDEPPALAGIAIVIVRVVNGEHQVQEKPRAQNG